MAPIINKSTVKFYVPERLDTSKEYDFPEVISDTFAYALSIDKIHIAFLFFKMYWDDVFENKEACIESIIQTFELNMKGGKIISFLEERLFLLETIIDAIQYDQALWVLLVYELITKYQ